MEAINLLYHLRELLRAVSFKTIGTKLFLSIVFAYLTAISARFILPLPFTPVPITGQVFVIMLSACLLGPIYGSLSQIIYVIAGAIGLPWYAGGLAGLSSVITGGYLIGFIVSAAIVGKLTSMQIFVKSQWRIMLAMTFGLIIIYFLGAFYLAVLMNGNIVEAIKLGVIPFILPDMFKIFLAANLAYYIRAKIDNP